MYRSFLAVEVVDDEDGAGADADADDVEWTGVVDAVILLTSVIIA